MLRHCGGCGGHLLGANTAFGKERRWDADGEIKITIKIKSTRLPLPVALARTRRGASAACRHTADWSVTRIGSDPLEPDGGLNGSRPERERVHPIQRMK